MAGNTHVSDDMVRRLETELREKKAFANGIIERAQAGERDLTEDERGLLTETRSRMEKIREQMEQLDDISRVATEYEQRAQQVDVAIRQRRGQVDVGPIEYRSTGEYMRDMYMTHVGNREARERLELFTRSGAAHVTTPDNLGVIPDPLIGPVINFVDQGRPVTNAIGPRPMPSANWHRPKVTLNTAVGLQGGTGAAAQEKSELTSQKMTITRLDGSAKTYGGYVNISRQLLDFSQPAIWDAITTDLAAQYAIDTEAALGDVFTASNNATNCTYDLTPSSGTAGLSVATAVWAAAALAYTATKGQGRLLLAIAPDVLSVFGPSFAPYGPYNQYGQGFDAGAFGQGPMGTISGVPVYMSAGINTGEAYLVSTAAIEVYEQRVGLLSLVEPSVLGTQVAFAGYYSPLVINADGIVPLVAGSL